MQIIIWSSSNIRWRDRKKRKENIIFIQKVLDCDSSKHCCMHFYNCCKSFKSFIANKIRKICNLQRLKPAKIRSWPSSLLFSIPPSFSLYLYISMSISICISVSLSPSLLSLFLYVTVFLCLCLYLCISLSLSKSH